MDSYNPDMEIESIEAQSPPPRPKPSRRNAHKPPKLRSSCDICAAAKVKCDRERPACQRCINSGMRCNYSVSKRMGKPPRKVVNGNPMPKKSDLKDVERRTSPISTSESEGSKALDDSMAVGIPDPFAEMNFESSILRFDQSPTLPWHDLNLLASPNNFPYHDDAFSNASGYMGLENSMAFIDNWGHSETHNELHSVSSNSSELASIYSAEQSPSPSPRLPQPQHPRRPGHSRKESCTNIASATLQSLHLPQISCQSNPTSAPNDLAPAASIDQVLATNRRAVQTFHQLLQCPCSSNSGMVLALAFIILKILSSYTAIGRGTSSRPARSVTSDHTSGASTPWEGERGMVMDIPISMGAYQIDAEDEMHLKLQLVINELRKVSKLVDAFQGRYCRNLPSGDGIYGALEKFLRAELKSASKELATALKNSEDM